MTDINPEQNEPWYRAAFGADYLARYAHRDEGEAALAVSLLGDRVHLPAGGRIFDLCCGAGRHLAPLSRWAEDAMTVGGDLSQALLSHAAGEEPSAHLARLDMRRLPFIDGSFDLVTNFFTAFGYFDSDEENFAVFNEVARILKPQGWFLFDFLNGELARRTVVEGPAEEIVTLADGTSWRVERQISKDGRRAEKRSVKLHSGENQEERHESVRLFTQHELRRALSEAGFHIESTFGSYLGGSFNSVESPRAVFLARKIEE